MNTRSSQQRPSSRYTKKGRITCKVFFIDHQIASGNAFAMNSTPRQDLRGIVNVVNRFKNKIANNEKFKGKVNWAGIYVDGQPYANYTFRDDSDIRTWMNL